MNLYEIFPVVNHRGRNYNGGFLGLKRNGEQLFMGKGLQFCMLKALQLASNDGCIPSKCTFIMFKMINFM
jgi:hypothetical protein